jgi:putative copper export protein/methionine-rich copper-binding protein CopC
VIIAPLVHHLAGRAPRASRAPIARRVATLLGALTLSLFMVPALAQAAAATAHGTEPAVSASVPNAPSQIAVTVPGAHGPGSVAVLNATGAEVASPHATVRDGMLRASLARHLKPGVYTVAWSARGARPATGTYACSVSAHGAGPALVDDAPPPAALSPLGWACRASSPSLALVCAVLLAPAATATLRRGWSAGSRRDTRIMALALGAGILELLARVVPTPTPPNWGREIFTQLLDFGHLTAASIWVGGLVALTVLAASVRGVNTAAPALWGTLLKRFSVIATVCVGAMVLTGLWTYWIHVGPPKFLVHTLYGETLLVKLLLVAALLGLGAINQMWLLPRVQALRAGAADGHEGKVMRVTLAHFRKVVAIEAAIGLAILFVVPQLASSARNQAFQQAGGGLTADAPTSAGPVSVRRSGLEPGSTDYDIQVPGGAPAPSGSASSCPSAPWPRSRCRPPRSATATTASPASTRRSWAPGT